MDLMGNLVSVEGVDERERESLFQNGMAIVRRNGRRRFPLQRESDPLFRAVLADDLNALQLLVQAGNSVNIQNSKGTSLLNFVMRRKRVEMFDYLLSLEEIDVNYQDRLGLSPLLYLTGVCFDEYFAQQLLKRGADIHMADGYGFTFLHLAAKSPHDDNLSIGQMIIEKGANINEEGPYGVTPLYNACESGNFNWVCMLLYYGADANIPSDRGVLPIAVISENIAEEQQHELEEILFNYTFGEGKSVIRLPTLVASMTLNSSLFTKILDHISYVSYDRLDLQHLVSCLLYVKPKHLKLFFEKFSYIIKEMCNNFSPLNVLARNGWNYGLNDIIKIFLYSDHIAEFVQSSDPMSSTIELILFNYDYGGQDATVGREEATEMIYLMLTYGLSVTECDLDTVFLYFGYNELFKILLHMDITSKNCTNQPYTTAAVFFYNTLITIEDFLDNFVPTVTLCKNLLAYFNHPRLKEFLLFESGDCKQIEKIKNLPQVPLLLELSRNAARNFIVDRYNVTKSRDFYTVLQCLPIGEMNKKYIALERKLY